MTPHDANTGRHASKTVGPSEREKDDSGFFILSARGWMQSSYLLQISQIIFGDKKLLRGEIEKF